MDSILLAGDTFCTILQPRHSTPSARLYYGTQTTLVHEWANKSRQVIFSQQLNSFRGVSHIWFNIGLKDITFTSIWHYIYLTISQTNRLVCCQYRPLVVRLRQMTISLSISGKKHHIATSMPVIPSIVFIDEYLASHELGPPFYLLAKRKTFYLSSKNFEPPPPLIPGSVKCKYFTICQVQSDHDVWANS